MTNFEAQCIERYFLAPGSKGPIGSVYVADDDLLEIFGVAELEQARKVQADLQGQASSALADRRMVAETLEHKEKEILHLQNQLEESNQVLRRKEKAFQQLRLSKGMGGGA